VIENDEGNIYTFTEDIRCVFLSPDFKCPIYDDRPEVCRKYGLTDELPCPYVKKNGNPRSPAQARRMQRIINRQIDDSMKKIGKMVR